MRIASVARSATAAAAWIAACILVGAAARGQAPGAAAERECLFMKGTAIPRLAMGVCRPGDPPDVRAEGELRLWATTSPGEGEEPAATRPLFVPLYIYEERPGVGTTWYRLGEAYAPGPAGAPPRSGPLGWVDGRHLHLLESRYAYHFSNPQRVKPGVQLYATKAAAYAALQAQQRKPPADAGGQDVLVAERLEEKAWDPLASGAVPPFVELRDSPGGPAGGAAVPEANLPDTTHTFPLPAENRLVRLGAVGGGAIDRKKLAEMEKEARARAGIEIAFVIDETRSMKPWFGQVADFIEQNLALGGNATNVKIATSWYSDDYDRKPSFATSPLQELVGPTVAEPAKIAQRKEEIVRGVREHPERIVAGDQTAPELVFRGLEAAIQAAGFTPGENAMVFVIGDASDRTGGTELEALLDRIAALIQRHNLQVAFIQVGDPKDSDPKFVAQAESLKRRLPADKQDEVVIQGVNNQALKLRIADIQARMEANRERLLRDIAKIETRNCYAKPGPGMVRLIEDDGLTLRQFDEQNLQYFMPAYGWLYNPLQPDARPQLRELVFLAKPEELAVMAAMKDVLDVQVRKAGKVDGDATVKKLAEVLAKQSGHSQVKGVLEAAWDKMPAGERTVGAFLRDVLGLRVRNAVLYHRGVIKPGPASDQAIGLLREHTERLAGAAKLAPPRPGMPPPVWRDAWSVLP